MESTLRIPVSAKFNKRPRGEWDTLIRRRETLNEERKRLDRESDAMAKDVAELDAELLAFVESETAGEKQQRVTLKSFILSILWQKPSAMAVAFKAYGRLSKDDKAALAVECGERQKLDIQWRDAPPPADAAAAA